MNPLLLGLSGSERENVLQNIDTAGFNQLVETIENLLQTNPETILSEGSSVYQTANTLLIDALNSGASQKVSPRAVDDVTFTVNGNNITYTNPWLVYYASNVHDTNTNTDLESYLIGTASFHYWWGWPPYYLDESQTQKTISDGDYTISLTTGRGLVWDMESHRFKAFGANCVNLLLKLFSIPFPALGLIPDPVAAWLDVQSILELYVPTINDELEAGNYVGALAQLISVMDNDISLIQLIAEHAGASNLASVCGSRAAAKVLSHITKVLGRIASVISVPEKLTFIVHWCTAPDFEYSGLHVGPINNPPTITLSAPTGGETWSANRLIMWSATDDDDDTLSIDISYSANGGSTWSTISSSETNDGSYLWNTASVANGSSYRIKVVVSDGQATDTASSGSNFTISNAAPNNPPNITLTSPTGGETWSANRLIMWSATDDDDDTLSIDISYSANGGSTWSTISSSETNDGSYLWNTASVANGSSYRIKVVVSDGQATDTASSGSNFTISNAAPNNPPNITLTSPTGGETWSANRLIMWSATDDDDDTLSIDISYSANGGSTWSTISSSETNDGSYLWNTASVANGSSYRIKVVVSDGQATDTASSGSNFTISNAAPNNPPNITLTSPTGGETWSANRLIMWSATDDDDDTLSIDISYSANGGSTWSTISSSETNDGSYLWNTASVANGSSYRIKVVVSDGQATDTASSGSNFTVDNSGGGGGDLDLVYIEPGTFQMGSVSGYSDETPVHTVTITQGFWMGKYEVTQAQWRAVVEWKQDNGGTSLSASPSYFSGDDRPVEYVSWNDCQSWLAALSEMTGKTYRLPTEAEWEYACRAGSTTEYSFGDDAGTLGNYAWYSSNSGSNTHPVGGKLPNAWGLCDMHGNVWEWCQDWYGSYTSGTQTDPTGPSTGSYRVLRGGSWFNLADRCRSAYRYLSNPDSRSCYYGLRVVSVSED